eukprot:SAG22_NODE_37_length_26837_cov_8.103523_6_plen_528_part_00
MIGTERTCDCCDFADVYIALAHCRILSLFFTFLQWASCGRLKKSVYWQLRQPIEVRYVDTRADKSKKGWTCMCAAGSLVPLNAGDNDGTGGKGYTCGYRTLILDFTSCGTLMKHAKEWSNMLHAFKILLADPVSEKGKPLEYFLRQSKKELAKSKELQFKALLDKHEALLAAKIAKDDLHDEKDSSSSSSSSEEEELALSPNENVHKHGRAFVGKLRAAAGHKTGFANKREEDSATKHAYKAVSELAQTFTTEGRLPVTVTEINPDTGTFYTEEEEAHNRPIVTLTDFNPHARFYRAFYDIMISVLFYSALKSTIPLMVCTPLNEARYWQNGDWNTADIGGEYEVVQYLDADLREQCWDGPRFWVTFGFALLVIFCLFFGPTFSLVMIHKYHKAHAKKHGRARHDEKRGVFKNCLQAVFLGRPPDPTLTVEQEFAHQKEYEERLLREPFSVLYAMNDEHTWWWFMMDIARKMIVSVVYACRNWEGTGFNWQAVLLVLFVAFATVQDMVQVRLSATCMALYSVLVSAL